MSVSKEELPVVAAADVPIEDARTTNTVAEETAPENAKAKNSVESVAKKDQEKVGADPQRSSGKLQEEAKTAERSSKRASGVEAKSSVNRSEREGSAQRLSGEAKLSETQVEVAPKRPEPDFSGKTRKVKGSGEKINGEPQAKESVDRVNGEAQPNEESADGVSGEQEPKGRVSKTKSKKSIDSAAASDVPAESSQDAREGSVMTDGEKAPGAQKPEVLTAEEKKQRDRQKHKERVSRRFEQSGSVVAFDMASILDSLDLQSGDYTDDDGTSDYISFDDSDERTRPSYRHKSLLERNVLDTVVQQFHDSLDGDLDSYLSGQGSKRGSDQEIWEQISADDLDTVQMKTDFLNNFEMPDLSDVSEEETTAAKSNALTAVPSKITDSDDVGVFVNPLTGDILSSSSTKSSEELPMEKVEEEMALSDVSSGMLDFIDSDDAPKETAKTVDEEANKDDAFVNFQQSLIYMGHDEPSTDEDKVAKSAKTEMQKITNEFLDDLLNEVITKSELLCNDNRLRAKCDHKKLADGIAEAIENYESERLMNIYLNARTSDYYKRQRIHRVFNTLPSSVECRERKRYLDMLNHLDYVRKRNAEAKSKNANLMASVLMDLQYAQTFVKHSELHIEHTMRHYLVRKDSEYLRRIVDRELKLMEQKRNEISDARLFLITRKHSLGRVTDKIHQLEKVSEDLLISDFVAIQNQVVALDKKIEERNLDLKKLLTNYQVELHQIQHNHEKTLVLADMLEEKKAILRSKQERQLELRESLYQEKMQRTRLQQRHKELSFKGGILSMPALMTDYDVTLQKVEEKRVSVAKLKESLKSLSARVAYYESRNL